MKCVFPTNRQKSLYRFLVENNRILGRLFSISKKLLTLLIVHDKQTSVIPLIGSAIPYKQRIAALNLHLNLSYIQLGKILCICGDADITHSIFTLKIKRPATQIVDCNLIC